MARVVPPGLGVVDGAPTVPKRIGSVVAVAGLACLTNGSLSFQTEFLILNVYFSLMLNYQSRTLFHANAHTIYEIPGL